MKRMKQTPNHYQYAAKPVRRMRAKGLTATLACSAGCIGLLAFGESVTHAAITMTGIISPTYNGDDPWDAGNSLTVGNVDQSTLRIDSGSIVNNEYGYIGRYVNMAGTATVAGTGSVWNNSTRLTIGDWDVGTLNIEDGGAVSSRSIYMGYRAGSSGTATVSGTGSNINDTGTTFVGYEGTGTLNIENGAAVHTKFSGYIGYEAGSTGTATVTGAGSHWRSDNGHYIGYTGVGTLNIENGGHVISSDSSYIANTSGSSGTVNVMGTDSKWTNGSNLSIGREGTGALNIEGGGAVSNSRAHIGDDPGSSGTVTVSGPGSHWSNTTLYVAGSGEGTLSIYQGGTVSSSDGSIGQSLGSNGLVTIKGDGSEWHILSHLHIGQYGSGTLNIEDGGVVNASQGHIYRGSATVSGNGSAWNNVRQLYVAEYGSGTLDITTGGVVSNTDGYVGHNINANGTVTVTGNGATWNNSDDLRVGHSGTGTLRIEYGGSVNNEDGSIGVSSNSTGTITVSGPGSTWQNNGFLYVGDYGTGTLNITDGGAVTSNNHVRLGDETDSHGTINLSGGTFDIRGKTIKRGEGAAEFNFTGGTLRDAQAIDLGQPFVQDGGVLAPGGSIGLTHIFGDYALNAGILEIELGGIGNPHDVLTATGDIDIATLGTTLDLPALGPMDAGTYTIIETTGGTVSGMFEHVTGLGLYDGLVDLQYGATSVTITLNSDYVPEPGTAVLLGVGTLAVLKGRRW